MLQMKLRVLQKDFYNNILSLFVTMFGFCQTVSGPLFILKKYSIFIKTLELLVKRNLFSLILISLKYQ